MWLIDSSIGRKLVMSITGLFLILFLVFHMSMNLVAIISGDAYNAVCGFLGANWYAVVGTGVLAAGFILHIVFAFILEARNRKSVSIEGRSSRYEYTKSQDSVEWSSRNMLALGAIVLGLLIMHLCHFWAKMQLPELMGAEEAYEGQFTDGAALINQTFANPIICVCYLAWFVALWFHLTHGFWSAFQTMGLNGKTWFPRLKCISCIFATIICLGFAAVVIFGCLKGNGIL